MIRKLPSTGDRPQHSKTPTGLPEGIFAGGSADSAGTPWAGRTFNHHETAFADDDGTTPESYQLAVTEMRDIAEQYQRAIAEGDVNSAYQHLRQLAEAHKRAVSAFAEVRVLVPLVAVGGDFGTTPTGKIVEKTQELSIVTVKAPDGRETLPVFTSTAAMAAWDPTARPIPVPAPQAVIAAGQEGTELIVVDPGTEETELVIRRNQLAPIAMRQIQYPSWYSDEIQQQLRDAFTQDSAITGLELLPGDPQLRMRSPEIEAVVTIKRGYSSEELQRIIAAAQERWTAVPELVEAIDSMRIRVIAAD